MTATEFTDTVLSMLRRRPFIPFTVELVSGERYIVKRPDKAACDGGSAGFSDDDGEIYFFDYTDTKSLELTPPQTAFS
jgi:hypothetical protein